MYAIRNGNEVIVTDEQGQVKFDLRSHNQSELLCMSIGKLALDLLVINPQVPLDVDTLKFAEKDS